MSRALTSETSEEALFPSPTYLAAEVFGGGLSGLGELRNGWKK